MREEEKTYSATNGAAVTPSDTDDLSTPCRAIYVGVTGDVTVTLNAQANGASITFSNLPVGFAPLQCKRIWATGTTATNINALY